MKTKIALTGFLIMAFLSSLMASVFIGPSTALNRLILTTNQVAMITGIYPKYLYDTNESQIGSEASPLGASIITPTITCGVYMGVKKS